MGYQLPGIANVAFAGFTALSKQSAGADARANNKKKGKDRGHSAAPAARPAKGANRSSQTTVKEAGLPWISCESVSSRSFLLKCRQDLRPLLNALRFVESSNRENCPDGDSGASIGPFQISRQYHQDAWKQTSAMASSIAWSRCRDLNHAENTVVAYWTKYCPAAVETRDFETLAKIHNGGPQGPKKVKTEYYWSKVSEQLSKQEVVSRGRSKENISNDSSGNPKHARQESKIHERSPSALLSIANRLPTSRIQKTGSMNSPKNFRSSNQRTALMQNGTPTLFQQSSVNFSDRKVQEAKRERERHSCEKPKLDSSQSELKRDVKIVHSKIRQDNAFTESRLTHKRHRQSDSVQSINVLEYGRAFHLGYWKVLRGLKHEKAAVIIQAFWKMYSMRSQFKRLKVAAVLIQRQWRSKNASLPVSQHKPSSKSHNLTSTALIVMEGDCEHIRPAGLPCELLYKGDISPKQEDALLTELANLLKWEGDCTDNLQSCHSFRFARSEEDNQACTPKLGSAMKMSPKESEGSSAWAKRSCGSSTTASQSHDTISGRTSLSVEESLEKEILDEFAKLFPYVHDTTLDVDSTSGDNCAIDEIVNEENMDKVFSPPEHGIIRRLQFDSTKNVEDLGCRDLENVPQTEKLAESVNNLQTQTDADEDEELKDIKIPLLVDNSPVMKSRSVRMKNQINPCCRKVEKALVSSLSEWQFSAFEMPGDELINELGAKDPSSARYQLALWCKEESGMDPSSARYQLAQQCKEDWGMDVPSRFICQSSLQQSFNGSDSAPLNTVSYKIDVPVESPPEVPRSDCFLETSDRRNSTVYCRALFQCMSLSFDKFEEVDDDGAHQSRDGNLINECGCTTVANNIPDSACLSDLCDLWNEHNVDLLTRSLKYKNLQASGGIPNMKWEMQCLERFPKQLEEESRELVKRQRDVIYTNIAAYCGMHERHQLYQKWGIQKLLTGRLKKIIYELLWIDPERYAESADLVIQYL